MRQFLFWGRWKYLIYSIKFLWDNHNYIKTAMIYYSLCLTHRCPTVWFVHSSHAHASLWIWIHNVQEVFAEFCTFLSAALWYPLDLFSGDESSSFWSSFKWAKYKWREKRTDLEAQRMQVKTSCWIVGSPVCFHTKVLLIETHVY